MCIGGDSIGSCWKHFKTICRHKAEVFKECKACGITWRGIVHDLSKFSPAEFVPSAKYFQGNRSPIEAEKEAVGYSNAWLHHKSHNKHHWEYWCDYDNDTGAVFPHKIPYVYVVEMICDWIGAGKVYGGSDWNQEEPLKYYNKVRAGRHFHDDTEKLIVSMLETISNRGLDTFHKKAKSGLWNDWYETGCKRTGHVEPHIVLETPLMVEFVSQNEEKVKDGATVNSPVP